MKRILILLSVLLLAVGCRGRVILGDEQFGKYLPLLEGRRVAILSNHSGIVGDKVENWCLRGGQDVTPDMVDIPFGAPSDTSRPVTYGPHLLDVLLGKGVNVTAIFSPEHGFRGKADAGEHVASAVDEATGVPILSLYENGSSHPSEASMSSFDVLLVDIQDVGLRYYTYYVTMRDMMDACAIFGKKVIILDRPNPNGWYVDGPILDMRYASGIGSLPIAMVHGMTLGELGLMISGEGWLSEGRKCDLTVIPCRRYTHGRRTTLVVPPSPNLKDMRSIYLYSSTCFFEGTQVTAGRGTPWPFNIYGHPDLRGGDFTFTPVSMPGATRPRYQDRLCRGTDLRGEPIEKIWTEQVNMEYLLDAFSRFPVDSAFFLPNGHFERQIGVDYAREMILSGASAAEIEAKWTGDVARFKEQRRPYLLYKD